jgi:hypothetical protein
MYRKFFRIFAVLSILILGAVVGLLRVNIGRGAGAELVSQSGRYKIESVNVLFPYVYDNYVYFRVIDLDNPSQIYRSPIVRDGVDFHSFENSREVGVVWLGFNKRTHEFHVSFPGWHESWINLFISNTPYTVITDD